MLNLGEDFYVTYTSVLNFYSWSMAYTQKYLYAFFWQSKLTFTISHFPAFTNCCSNIATTVLWVCRAFRMFCHKEVAIHNFLYLCSIFNVFVCPIWGHIHWSIMEIVNHRPVVIIKVKVEQVVTPSPPPTLKQRYIPWSPATRPLITSFCPGTVSTSSATFKHFTLHNIVYSFCWKLCWFC